MSVSEQWGGRVALVTGASSGIGRAIAEALVADGLRVAALGRNQGRLDALAQVCGQDLLPVVCDVRDEASVKSAFAAVAAKWGGVDVLVNNAGLGHGQSLFNGETEKWREVLEVNVLALAVFTRETLAQLEARGAAGHIVHVSSMSAHRIAPGSGMYGATKFAVRALTESLRKELWERKSRTRVTAISPGLVETGFHAVFTGSEKGAREIYDSMKVLDPADIVSALRYVLSQPPHVQVHDVLVRPTEQGT